MLRITVISHTAFTVTLLIEGRIAAEWVAVLESEVAAWLEAKTFVELDFASVSYVDEAGITLLRSFPKDRVRIGQCSAFIRVLLEISNLA